MVYGLWAIFVLVPLLRQLRQSVPSKTLGWTGIFAGPNYGIGMLAAGVILAIMILPIISSLTREVMTAVPHAQREAVLALGATRWEMIRMGVLRNARIGIVGAVILGLGRALGETMAVTMVIGNRPEIASLCWPRPTAWPVSSPTSSARLRPALPERAGRDRPGTLHRHHHRERAGPAAGMGGDPRRAGRGA